MILWNAFYGGIVMVSIVLAECPTIQVCDTNETLIQTKVPDPHQEQVRLAAIARQGQGDIVGSRLDAVQKLEDQALLADVVKNLGGERLIRQGRYRDEASVNGLIRQEAMYKLTDDTFAATFTAFSVCA